MLNFNLENYKSGIARRLIVYVVLFSSLITLLTTAMQLYRDYNNDINLIEDQLQQAQDVHLKALTATLWASDTKELKTHLEGISQLRDMQFLEVRDQEKVWVSVGTPQSENVMSRQYPMIYPHRGRDIEIGTLTVVASLSGIYQRLIGRVWVILVSNAVKTFLVAGFILVIFHTLITRHLIRIANFTRALDIDRLDKRLDLGRKGYREQKMDELDLLVNAINQMQVNIKESFTALEQSEERFQILAKVSPVGIFRTDAQGNCIYANERWREQAGMSEAEALGEGWAQALHPEDRERVFTDWYQAAADKVPFKTECRFQRPDGKVTWLLALAEAELDAGGEVVGYVGALTNITERKRIEQILQSLAGSGTVVLDFVPFLHEALSNLTDFYGCKYAFVGQLLADGKSVRTLAVRVGGQVAENFEYDLEGTPCQDILDQKIELIPRNAFAVYAEDKMLVDMNVESYFGAPLILADGKTIGLVSVMDTEPMFLDPLSEPILGVFASRLAVEFERRRTEEELQKHRDHLEDLVAERTAALKMANQELESFSYSVSHDLRAPLRSIDGFSQAILEDYADKLDEAGKDHLQRVRRASQRMGELIDDLLTLSRVTRRKMHRNAIDLSQLALKIAAQIKEHQPDCMAEFMIQKGQTAHGDPHLLRIVLDNLLGNAWKYSSKETQAHIEFGAMTTDGKPAYYVRDNGVGFDMKYADKLFGAFQRLHKAEEFEGTGIGLATVQRIIHRHGGRVWAEGELGKGATFYFTLAGEKAN